MPQLQEHLIVERCPYCRIDNPNLQNVITSEKLQTVNRFIDRFTTWDYTRTVARDWKVYKCSRCGGLVLASGAATPNGNGEATEMHPAQIQVDENLPATAKEYLTQAINSLHAPAGSVMLCASAVDAMLKALNYIEGNLYNRINRAAAEHLITEGMKEWAHEVRLDANDQRHADYAATMPTTADAQRSVDFVQALGQFLFTLPAQVARGRANAQTAH